MTLTSPTAADRLQAALAAGTYPDPDQVDVLVERCGVEPDFYVRDMLTWALVRQPAALTVPLLLEELRRDVPQARSQALHTLSKIGDPAAWPAITTELLHDPDDEVARSAWRAAVVLVPEGSEGALARQLADQLGRGGRDVQLSLSRALAALGDAARPAVTARGGEHALATVALIDDPELSFEAAVFDARRIIALDGAPGGGSSDSGAPDSGAPDSGSSDSGSSDSGAAGGGTVGGGSTSAGDAHIGEVGAGEAGGGSADGGAVGVRKEGTGGGDGADR